MESERHATWLELFFDLVFVASITAISSQVSKQTSIVGILANLGLFIPIWWAWLGHTVYANRFATEDAPFRLLTFVIMLSGVALAVQASLMGENGGQGFALAYCTARICLLLLYARIRHRADAHFLARLYLVGFGLGVAIWLSSLLVPPPMRYGVWALGLLVDFATPWIGRPGLQKSPLNVSHLPERVGLFVLIVLGESMVAMVAGISHVAWGIAPVVVALLSFAIAVCIWWFYFSFVQAAEFECSLGSGQPYLYSHLPFVLGLTALAAGVERAIGESTRPALAAETLLLLGTGTVAWFLSFYLIKRVSYDRLPRRETQAYAGASAAAILLVTLGRDLPPVAVMAGLATLFLVALRLAKQR